MKVYYDFHIHSALSPCADKENTPANIVNMAALKGLSAIAIADHNSAANCRPAIAMGKERGITVVPAMELTTSEDAHILCLFEELSAAEEFERHIRKGMLKVKNDKRIFGAQYVYGQGDEIIGEEEYLLSVATAIPSHKAARILEQFNGIAIPAHIDREANGMLSILGFLDGMGFECVELSSSGKSLASKYSPDYNVLINSDAHCLSLISEAENALGIEGGLSPKSIISAIRRRF